MKLDKMGSMKNYGYIGILLLITFITLFPCLKNGYCNWDDHHLIMGNNAIKDLSWNNIKEIFTSGYLGTYIPLTIFSFAIEYKLFRLNPFISHLINLVFHLFNVLLVFWFIYRLSKNSILSFIVALFFGIHPLRVESVAWATERKDMLYSFFFLGGLISYIYFQMRQHKRYYCLSLLLFLLSILSKPMAATFPLILILLNYYQERRFTLQQLYDKIPFLLITIVFSVINIVFQGSGAIPLLHYFRHFFIFCYNILFYLYKLILPLNLSCFYPYPEKFEHTLPPVFLIAPLIITGLVIIVVRTKMFTNKIIFGSLFFILTILPVSQIIPLVAPAIAADRYTYIPATGLFFVAGIIYLWLYNRFKERSIIKIILVVFLIALFSFYSFLSFNRCKVWKDSITLWNDVLEKFPDCAIAYNNRGNAYNFNGQYEKAISDFDKAIEINPVSELAYFNRGIAYEKLKIDDKAIADFTNALNIQPAFIMGYVNRGAIYARIGEYDKAYDDLTRALQLNPHLAEAYYNLGVLYFNIKNYDLALKNYDKALEIDKYLSVVHVSKGDIYFIYGDFERAIENYTKAIEIDPMNVDAYYNRAVTSTRLGNLERALKDYNQVLKLNPNFAHAYNNRGNIYLDFGEVDKAVQDYNKAIELDSTYAPAFYNRATAYYTLGDFDKARSDAKMLEKLGVIPDSNLLKLLRQR
ncbi:MAG: tetratricopeptide repeat protein [bacterium]